MSIERHRVVIVPILIAATLTILFASPATAVDSTENDKWHFELAPYVWLPTIDGKLGFDVPGFGDGLEIDPATIIEDLQLTGMLGFEARKNRWSALADVIYLDMADEKESVIPIWVDPDFLVNFDARLELKSWIVQMAGAYDVIHTDRANLGVLFGLRYFSMNADLTIQIDGPLQQEPSTGTYSETGEVLDGIVGIRGRYGRRWYVPFHLDLGTGGSEFTWQAMTGFGYRWTWGGVLVVYRYMSFDEGDDGFFRELSLSGPAVGVNFRF